MQGESDHQCNPPSPDWQPGLGMLGHATEPTITALTACFLPAEVVGTPTHDDVARKVRGKFKLMPVLVAAPVLFLTLVFELSARVRFGKASARLDGRQRATLLGLWRRAPLGLLRDLVKVHERLNTFVYFGTLCNAAEDRGDHRE